MIQTILKSMLILLLFCSSSLLYAGTISKQQAASSAQQAHHGRVLSVRLKRSVYKVKILNKNGQVRIVKVDAKTGRVR